MIFIPICLDNIMQQFELVHKFKTFFNDEQLICKNYLLHSYQVKIKFKLQTNYYCFVDEFCEFFKELQFIYSELVSI